jgi:formiminoglutamase
MSDWLEIMRGPAPLIVSIPHAGTEIPGMYAERFQSLWLARKDADWWLPQLYAFAEDLGATVIRTHISRSVIDVNRDPSGVSLYPGQATTELCPTTTFDGEPLYKVGFGPDDIEERKAAYFAPYHAALASEIARLRAEHPRIALYDCHSIRSNIPRLFDGELPNFNIGTNDGKSCDGALTARVQAICAAAAPDYSHILNGRFKGGYITRHYGNPAQGVHAIQMELACRGYMREPATPTPETWPAAYDSAYAATIAAVLQEILTSILESVTA